jgi:hypothetical protein
MGLAMCAGSASMTNEHMCAMSARGMVDIHIESHARLAPRARKKESKYVTCKTTVIELY